MSQARHGPAQPACQPAFPRDDLLTNPQGQSVTWMASQPMSPVTNRPINDLVRPDWGAANVGPGTSGRKPLMERLLTGGRTTTCGDDPRLAGLPAPLAGDRTMSVRHTDASGVHWLPSKLPLARVSALRGASRLLLFVLFAACATGRGAHSPPTNTSLLTQEEIESSHQPTLFDVVRALRPTWLRQVPTAVRTDQETGVSVYLDNQRAGGVEVLRDMASTTAVSLRFYSASEAQSRFGLGNLHGVIQVTTAHGR